MGFDPGSSRPDRGEGAAAGPDDRASARQGGGGQAAVAELGRFALASRDSHATVARAVALARRLLAAPMGCLTEVLGPNQVRVLHSSGPTGLAVGSQATSAEGLGGLIGRSSPYVVGDWRLAPGRPQPAPVHASGAVSSVTATVHTGGRPCRLSVLDGRPRRFSDTEVDLVQSIAHVLGSALERHRAEAMHAAVAAFGRFAMTSADIAVTVHRALALGCEVLELPIGMLCRVVGPDRVRVLAARGLLGLAEGEETELPANLLAASGGSLPLVIGDWRSEQAFRRPPVVRDSGGLSAIGVAVLDRHWSSRLLALDSSPRDYSRSELDFVQAIAHLVAAALERHQAEAAHAAIAAFGRQALQSRDIVRTAQQALDLACEVLDAPLGAVSRILAPGRQLQLCEHGPTGRAPGVEFDVPADPARPDTGEPLVVNDAVSDRADDAASGRADDAVGDRRCSVSVSVLVGSRPWGRLAVLDTRPRRFTPADGDFLQSLAHLLAAAVERHRVESRLRETTRQFQRALLPGSLPALPGVETAARYVPAGGEVGGDWYDALPLPHGGVALVMGDVEGHDATAAALMGQLRNVLRAYAGEGRTPAEVLSRLNQFLVQHGERLATCCYAELYPDERTVTCASAGHPAPLLLGPDGSLRPLPVPPGLLLGLDPGQDYLERTTLLPAQCRLLLRTDGLSPQQAQAGPGELEPLAAAARALHALPIEALADGIIARTVAAPEPRDDAALLAVGITAPARPPEAGVCRVWGSSPLACRAARRFVTDVLAGWQLADLQDRAELAVSELVTNVVVHTTSPVRLTVRRTGPERVWLGVQDSSEQLPSPMPPAPVGPNGPAGLSDPDDLVGLFGPDDLEPDDLEPGDLEPGGRGLAIVDRIADRWGVEPSTGPGGKTVWLELALTGGQAVPGAPAGPGTLAMPLTGPA